jgi:hypothetical protein
MLRGVEVIGEQDLRETLHVLLKYKSDIDRADERLAEALKG